MKKAIIFFYVVSFLLVSCNKDDLVLKTERKDIKLSTTEIKVTEVTNGFGLNLFRSLCDQDNNANIFISPFSVSVALSTVNNGALGKTKEEIKNVLGFAQYSSGEMNSYFKKMTTELLELDPLVTLKAANSIWLGEDFNVKNEFIDINKNYYDTEVRYLDFTSPTAHNVINQWCSDKTNKRIKEVVERIDANTRLLILNALYFNGVWKNMFEKENTVEDIFVNEDGNKVRVSMMKQEYDAFYAKNELCEIAELPFGNEAFNMLILLPDSKVDIDQVIEELTPENWTEWTRKLDLACLDINFPKFKIDYKVNLKDICRDLGIQSAFSPSEADFSNIADESLYIGLLQQNTFIEVNEEGAECAGTSVIELPSYSEEDSKYVPFYIARPFIFVIREKSTNAILFIGKVGHL